MKRITIIAILTMVMSVLSGCLNIPIGDGNKLKISKKGITITDNEGQEHSLTIDEENENITFSGFGEDGEEGFSFGSNLEIPDGLPSDIPIPKNAQIYQASNMQKVISVAFITETDKEKLVELYKKHFNSRTYEEVDISEYAEQNYAETAFYADRAEGTLMLSVVEHENIEKGADVRIVFQEYGDE